MAQEPNHFRFLWESPTAESNIRIRDELFDEIAFVRTMANGGVGHYLLAVQQCDNGLDLSLQARFRCRRVSGRGVGHDPFPGLFAYGIDRNRTRCKASVVAAPLKILWRSAPPPPR